MKQSSLMVARFPMVGNQTLHQHIELTKNNRDCLRAELKSPIYWIQRNRKVWWNLTLVKDWFLNGPGPNHDRLVEDYLKTLENKFCSGHAA